MDKEIGTESILIHTYNNEQYSDVPEFKQSHFFVLIGRTQHKWHKLTSDDFLT